MLPDTVAIRHFLKKTFSDEELTTLSFDYFPEVYQDFSSGMSKSNKIQLLLDYCQRRGQLPALQAMLERERPEQYQAQFFATLRVESASKTETDAQPYKTSLGLLFAKRPMARPAKRT